MRYPQDQRDYSLGELEIILGDAFDPTATPPQNPREAVVSGGGQSYSNWETSLADVRAALSKISKEDRKTLLAHVLSGNGLGDQAVYTALRRLRRHLRE